ncbi:translation initiation factor IF-2 N-terminal domain-containing protein [Nocardia mexicana]|uniref:Ribonuclease E n=1 Tax=Nocardia mexicana TaxID=279262 RepID=A0A370HCY8_9NOCA|nr:translation initiation factor IF-2 N-terminal domain-containing protein [Nocardia mexicana]RDI54361.1 ribonuclease E [Nocardia mexicana]
MADQEPQDTSQSNGEPASNEAAGAGEAAQLPERIRVHALAKLLGTTSRRILAHLTELGAEARSPQSNLDRTVAESVRDALVPDEEAGASGPAAATAGSGVTGTAPTSAQPTATGTTAGTPAAGETAGTAAAEVSAATGAAGANSGASGAGANAGTAEVGANRGTSAAGANAGTAEVGANPGTSAAGANAGTAKASAGTTATEPTAGAAAAESAGAAEASGGTAAGEATSGAAAAAPARTTAAEADEAVSASAGTVAHGAASSGQPGSAEPPHPSQSLFTSPFHAPEPPAPEPVVFEAPAVLATPLFLPPDATAAQEMRRKRRVERQSQTTEDKLDKPVEDKPDKPVEDKPAKQRPEDSVAADEAETESESGAWDDDQSRDDGEDGGRSRRRRRGRRGRGRGRGEQHADSDDSDDNDSDDTDRDSAESGSEDGDATEDGADEGGVPEGSSRRRRRRRRRKAGDDADGTEPSDDDPPNTVVHEREPRNKRRAASDEVQGISGSTRLEAKRQRRRDGREAGRRRPPILTESEFLARRESVDRVMVVREKVFPDQHDHASATTQVAVLEDNILVEHFVTSTGQASMVGNVYLGKVQNVLPSMEAAFVDIGRGRNGVLYAGEVNWEAAGLGGKERKIEQALKPGDTVLVQVSKDPVGHKGARLTTQISLAGRFLVYVPGGSSTGISRKLPDTERKRLKEILRDIVPQDAGVIIRTASEGVSETELARDVERLQATWKTIEDQSKNGSGAPKTLYEEPDLLVKVIRDLFNEDFSKLVIEGDRSWTTVESYIRTVAPDLLARVERYDNGNVDVFGSFRIDEQLAKALDRKVWLPSGGTLIIERTEAMTVIDVNTGKFTGAGGSNLEETVTRNNLEAAEEIVRQMRLRDIGGMIVVDFIDMVLESNRDLVLRRLTEALGRDRTRHQVSEVTSLGLVQMTRKKLGTGLVEAFSTVCEHCHGRGILVHNYPVETAPTEESSGRREGRRRRKDKEKDKDKPAAAPATNGTAAHVDGDHEEDAAAKRAHPVALAMAAHQAEGVTEAELEVVTAESGAASSAGTQAEPDAGTDRASSRESSGTATRSRRRARRGSDRSADRAEVAGKSADSASASAPSAAGSEAGASSPAALPDTAAAASSTAAASDAGVSSSTAAESDAGASSSAAAVSDSGVPSTAAAGADANASSTAALSDTAAAETSGTTASSDAAAPSGTAAAREAGVTSGAPAASEAAASSDPAATSAAGAPSTAASSDTVVSAGRAASSDAGASSSAEPSGAGSSTAAAPVSGGPAGSTAPAESGGSGTAASTGEQAPDTARRGRRRVARSTAAPSTDAEGAVFVLSSTEQQAPSVDLTDIPAPEVPPRSRPRRRSAGRAAGAPEQSD